MSGTDTGISFMKRMDTDTIQSSRLLRINPTAGEGKGRGDLAGTHRIRVKIDRPYCIRAASGEFPGGDAAEDGDEGDGERFARVKRVRSWHALRHLSSDVEKDLNWKNSRRMKGGLGGEYAQQGF
ncbi:glutamate--tRNA ligase [Striga asiatica]|uniref:Glutamate--tRNA ligase n=1 Tax=Striga asiatica TaxID=4170 RepID=A0A5A7QNI1_STRAF|nr:glutamate--tRNA ligase [Striga asiatica]